MLDVFSVVREPPDTRCSAEFGGEPLVQSFLVPGGRVWITTAEALLVPAFGRAWVAGQLEERRAELGARAYARELRRGLRLHAAAAELALAA